MITACPLDCFDACSIVYDGEKIKPNLKHPVTKNFLCPFMNHFLEQKKIEKPIFNNKEISLDEALNILTQKIKISESKLFFKGSGNFGKMQDITSLFFEKVGFIFTKGSLCDGEGEAGVCRGRGESLALPLEVLEKSQTVVIWGRNITVTNSHLLPYLKNKNIITIDPVKTDIAKKSDIYLQIKPGSDIFLAFAFAKMIIQNNKIDKDFLQNQTNDFDKFYEILNIHTIEELCGFCDVKKDDVFKVASILGQKKVSILVGLGVQKYDFGSSALEAIDSLGAILGLFGKEDGGVAYLSNSSYGFGSPFKINSEKILKPTVDFGKFDLVFIQGSNPLRTLPNSNKVKLDLQKCNFKIYFGLYENETSKECDLVIPAKTFLEKEDVRFSYFHPFVSLMPNLSTGADKNQPNAEINIKIKDTISEYEFTLKMLKKFEYEMPLREREYINLILNDNIIEKNGFLYSKQYEKIPYSDGFLTKDKKFNFLTNIPQSVYLFIKNKLFLVTAKSKNSLNSQFDENDIIYVSFGLANEVSGNSIILQNYDMSHEFLLKKSDIIRDDCILIPSSCKDANKITINACGESNEGAVYQQTKGFLWKNF